jgi:hypothetical protein
MLCLGMYSLQRRVYVLGLGEGGVFVLFDAAVVQFLYTNICIKSDGDVLLVLTAILD